MSARRRLGRQTALETQARSGEGSALSELIRHHDRQMRALAWKMVGDAHVVDDVLQDAYLKAHRSIGRFRGEARFETWLHRIVANTCVDHLRYRAARNEVSIEVQPDVAVPADVDRIDDSELLRQALLSLPFEQRAAVLLIDCDGYSYEQAADALGISVTAVGSRLFRARSALQQRGRPIWVQ